MSLPWGGLAVVAISTPSARNRVNKAWRGVPLRVLDEKLDDTVSYNIVETIRVASVARIELLRNPGLCSPHGGPLPGFARAQPGLQVLATS